MSLKEAYLTKDNQKMKAGLWLRQIHKRSTEKGGSRLDMESAALLVLDMQKFFLKSESHAFIPSSEAIIPNVQRLIELFREAKRPVIFTRHALSQGEEPGIMGDWWRDTVIDGTWESELAGDFLPEDSEHVLRKTRYSAFVGTELQDLLADKKIKSLVITGVTTHLCCESTARDAFMKDYWVYFVVDATATWAEDLHISSLKTLSDGFASPVSTEDILQSKGGIKSHE